MAEGDNIITLKEAATRARTSVADVALTWATRHGVELVYGDDGALLGLNRQQFERALDPVDPVVRGWLSGEGRQLAERLRGRSESRGRTREVHEQVRRHLEGSKPPEGTDPGKEALARAINERERARPPAISTPSDRRWHALEEAEPTTAENVAYLKRVMGLDK